MRKLLVILLLVSSAFGTTTVSGNLKDLTGTAIPGSKTTFVRFWLRGCNGNNARINGTALIGPVGTTYYQDFTPNASGVVSGTIYSTRDSAGTGNGEIECGGSFTAVWYGVQIYLNGRPGPEMPVHAKNGATLDITSFTPISTTPVVTAPTGDTTYLRVDGGNSPVTGAITFNAATTFGANVSLGSNSLTAGAGTFTSENGIQVVGNGTNTTIAAAVTAAGTTGAVLIPPGYAGTDNASTSTAPMIDFRQNSQGGVGFWHGVRALFPATNLPGGNDYPTNVWGPADIPIATNPIDCTSTTTVAAGTTTITVGTCADPTGNGGPSGTTAKLSRLSGVTLEICSGVGTCNDANSETVTFANWSIIDATHLSITTTLSHTQPYTVRQRGSIILATESLVLGTTSVSSAQAPITVTSSDGSAIATIPLSSGSTWPYGGWQWGIVQTGQNGTNKDLVFRHNNSASKFIFQNAAGASNLFTLDNSGNGAFTVQGSGLAIGKTTPSFALDVEGAAIGSGFAGVNIGDATSRVEIGYSTTALTGTKNTWDTIQWGANGTSGNLEIGSRGNQTTDIVLYTSPDAGTTGLVEGARLTTGALLKSKTIAAYGTAAGLTGTGACATITTQTGGAWAGRATCTGTTGASTFIITPGTTAPNGWVCYVQDETTRANLLQQTSTTATACTLTATSVTQNDVVVFMAVAF